MPLQTLADPRLWGEIAGHRGRRRSARRRHDVASPAWGCSDSAAIDRWQLTTGAAAQPPGPDPYGLRAHAVQPAAPSAGPDTDSTCLQPLAQPERCRPHRTVTGRVAAGRCCPSEALRRASRAPAAGAAEAALGSRVSLALRASADAQGGGSAVPCASETDDPRPVAATLAVARLRGRGALPVYRSASLKPCLLWGCSSL